MGQNHKRIVLVPIEVSQNAYEKFGGSQEEFSKNVGPLVNELASGAMLIPSGIVNQLAGLIGHELCTPETLIPLVRKAVSKDETGRTVLHIAVDPAFVDDLKNWARAGGHQEDWEQYVTRAFSHIMHQGWLCGVPTEAIQIELSPDDHALIVSLTGISAKDLTGYDVALLVKSAKDLLEQAQPAGGFPLVEAQEEVRA